MPANLQPQRAIVPIVRGSSKNPLSEVLGTGFFVGDGNVLHLVTARHVIANAPLAPEERYALVLTDEKGIAVVSITSILADPDFDVAVCVAEQSHLGSAIPLPLATFDPHLNDDVMSYEYSSTRIEKTDSGFHVSFEPYAHKGNVVRMYVSSFPEAKPTPSLLTSFPALQGASGAPVIVGNRVTKQFAVVGMLVANAERHLLPAQVVQIQDGTAYTESTSYFLPYGKAVSWPVLSGVLERMGVPFARSHRGETADER